MTTLENLNAMIADYNGMIRKRNEEARKLDEDLRKFVKLVAEYLVSTGRKNYIILGDNRQGIKISTNEVCELNGLFTRTILEGYYDLFAEVIKKDTADIQQNLKIIYNI